MTLREWVNRQYLKKLMRQMLETTYELRLEQEGKRHASKKRQAATARRHG